jgi:putative membrane protein
MAKKIIQQAEFNPIIRRYIFWVGFFALIGSVIGIVLLPFWILGLGQYFGKRYFKRLECTLTDKHLDYKKGAIMRVEKTIPLENIQDLTFIDNPILRIFDLRILKVETAGNSGSNGADMKLMGIRESKSFKEKVLDQRDLLKSNFQQFGSINQNDEMLLVLKEIRDLLKAK